MKTIKITDIHNREVEVNVDTKKLHSYNNAKKVISWNAEIVENGVRTGFFTDYEEVGTIDDIEEKLKTFANPVRAYYAKVVNYDSDNEDENKAIWNDIVAKVKENEDKFFYKNGNWKKSVKFVETILKGE